MGPLVLRERRCLFCFRYGLAGVGRFSVRKEIQKQVGLSMQSPNPALKRDVPQAARPLALR